MSDIRYNALYARQSIEKKDSISIESQLEYCRYEAHGEHCMEYTDKGFSGKDTNRPSFEKMMKDIRTGIIKRVIVYKLDRISRSILDFANMMELFQNFHVEFVSSTEKFDTSTPIGRAMLNICIVFAQLERETIQKRITDAYYARCRHGFYMGGRVPYGYRLTDTIIDNIHTSMYTEVPKESEQLKQIYAMYAESSNSLGDIVQYFNKHQIKHLRGANWNTARISELLRNPIYVQADTEVYRFFQSQGAIIHNPINEFIGYYACYLYKGVNSNTRRQSDLSGKELVLAPHKGLIPAPIWLACRKRCQNNRSSAATCKAQTSWLSGKIKCGNCGYALIIRKAKTKYGRYFVCSQSGKQGHCKGAGCTIYADILEEYINTLIQKRLSEFSSLSAPLTDENNIENTLTNTDNPPKNILQQQFRIVQIDAEIDALLSKVPQAENTLLNYINQKISQLDTERKVLQKEMDTFITTNCKKEENTITNPIEIWQALSFADRQAVVDIFIKIIRIANGKMEIVWNI